MWKEGPRMESCYDNIQHTTSTTAQLDIKNVILLMDDRLHIHAIFTSQSENPC